MNINPLIPVFVDTNIWLYAFIDSNQKEKSYQARELLLSCNPVISQQVINEVCVNLIKKASVSEDQVRNLITAFYEKYQVVDLVQDTLLFASELRDKYSISFWDSLVIASAMQAGVPIIYTEDLQHRQVFDERLTVINPFLS